MMRTAELLLQILRAELHGEFLCSEQISDCDLAELYRLSKVQNFLYCVTEALSKAQSLPKEEKLHEAYKSGEMREVVQIVRINDTFGRIRKIFTDAKIPFVPLKGLRLRKMYPDEMMRTSCDLDVLVKETDLDRASATLTDNGFSTDGKRHYHDISFYYGQVHLELHFSVCENMTDIDVLLQQVWENLVPVGECEYHESPEFFAAHHLAHMKYHFVHGGCGIRPFLDLSVMRMNGFYDEEKLRELLKCAALEKFYDSVLQIIGVWFDGNEETSLSRCCEEYILRGGMYGSMDNAVAVNSSVQNGKYRGALHLAFPGFADMCIVYPILKKKRFLLPVFYIRRITEKLFGRERKRVVKKMKNIITQDQRQIDNVGDLLSAMGIKQG